jgi:hypothetical protein
VVGGGDGRAGRGGRAASAHSGGGKREWSGRQQTKAAAAHVREGSSSMGRAKKTAARWIGCGWIRFVHLPSLPYTHPLFAVYRPKELGKDFFDFQLVSLSLLIYQLSII